MACLSSAEVKQLLVTNLPPSDQHNEIVEAVGEGSIRMRLPFNPAYLGADVWQHTGACVFSGPMTLGFAETAMFACIHGTLGGHLVAVTANLTATFLRPASAADLIAEARLVRAGKRHVYVETALYTDGDPDPVAHVTATYALLRKGTSAGAAA